MLVFHMSVGCCIGEIAFAALAAKVSALGVLSLTTLLFLLLAALVAWLLHSILYSDQIITNKKANYQILFRMHSQNLNSLSKISTFDIR